MLFKMANSAQTHKNMFFIWIVWSTLYVYLCLILWSLMKTQFRHSKLEIDWLMTYRSIDQNPRAFIWFPTFVHHVWRRSQTTLTNYFDKVLAFLTTYVDKRWLVGYKSKNIDLLSFLANMMPNLHLMQKFLNIYQKINPVQTFSLEKIETKFSPVLGHATSASSLFPT